MEHRGTDRRFPPQAAFTSRWSERHAAYISGLGTFGLHKGLITERGTCGRFVSVLTDLPLTPTARPYTGLYDYCTHCGACVRRCPVGAISQETSKDHVACAYFVDWAMALYAPPLWLWEMPGGGPLPVPQP